MRTRLIPSMTGGSTAKSMDWKQFSQHQNPLAPQLIQAGGNNASSRLLASPDSHVRDNPEIFIAFEGKVDPILRNNIRFPRCLNRRLDLNRYGSLRCGQNRRRAVNLGRERLNGLTPRISKCRMITA